MKPVVSLLLCTLAVFLALKGVAGTILLEDDFKGNEPGSDGASLWVIHSGDWHVTPEGFEGVDCEGDFTAAGAKTGRQAWQDYVLSLRLKIVSRGSDWRDGPWIGIRHRNSASAYTLGFYSRATVLHKASAGTQTGDKNPLAQSTMTIRDNDWHDLSVAAHGRQLRVLLDGAVIMEANDQDWHGAPPLESGGIVLAARKWEGSAGATRVLFDDVRVEAVGDAPDSLKLTPADAAQAARSGPSLLEYIRSARNRRYTRVPRHVLAFYYTWYGTPERHGSWRHWGAVNAEEHDIAASTHYPAKGAYDSHDPQIIDWHIDLAKRHGLTGFIATWWGQETFDDQAFRVVLDRAAKQDFRATVYWETAPGKGYAQIGQAVEDLLYLLNQYGGHPAFLTLAGKPVIFVYGRVMGQVPLDAWPTILKDVRDDYAKDFVLIADGYQQGYARVFDGVHTYNICGWVKDKTPEELRASSAESFESAVALARSQGKISCITIIPGYDDTKIREPGLNAKRQDGATYRVLWEEAIKADPDWVLITSWNEWHEGSEIEPSWEDGDTYIKMTKEYAAQFMATPFAKAEAPLTPASLDPAKARELCDLYEGKTLGILPDYGSEAVFWLADTGIALKELTWADVLDPETFNAKDLPLVLQAGGEGFVQSLREQDDVERALRRYMREGGFLMAIPFQPFPFYYNENRDTVVAAGRLGFPIVGSGVQHRDDVPDAARVAGWERPPEDTELAFHVNTTALAGLPDTVPFPSAGDLRWRPATPALVAEGDVYESLAQLKDAAGKGYGDGIVYVEHKRSEPRNGKNLYVWMRMPEALGLNEALFALFRFAAEKLDEEM